MPTASLTLLLQRKIPDLSKPHCNTCFLEKIRLCLISGAPLPLPQVLQHSFPPRNPKMHSGTHQSPPPSSPVNCSLQVPLHPDIQKAFFHPSTCMRCSSERAKVGPQHPGHLVYQNTCPSLCHNETATNGCLALSTGPAYGRRSVNITQINKQK